MKNLSQDFILALSLILVVFGYFQGVVVPETEMKYTQEAAVVGVDKVTSSIAKSLPCNPQVTKCGVIRILKNTVPDNYQDFTFVHQTIPGYVQTFILDDDASLPNPSTLSNMATFYTAYNGTYVVAEVVNPGFTVSISCTDQTGGTTVSGAIATISINNGESVTCIFKNVPVTATACGVPNTWTQIANFGGGDRVSAVGLSIGQKGYLGTGSSPALLPNQGPWKDFWEYNPTTNTWTQKADLGGVTRHDAVGFSIGTKGYLGLGRNMAYDIQNDLWEYNPTTNTWTQKADFLGGPRFSAVGFSIGLKGYVGTGKSFISLNQVSHQDFWEYNPTTNSWAQKADVGGVLRNNAVGFSIGTKGYVGTGSTNSGTSLADFWEYNPTTNSWTQKANFGGGDRTLAVGFSIGNKGYIGTGVMNGNHKKDFWEYNPTTNSWTQKADVGFWGRGDAVGFSIGLKGYLGTGNISIPIVGGVSIDPAQDFWCYTP